jgi:hypothetical protein
MKKSLTFLLIGLLAVLCLSSLGMAMGPTFTGPHTLAWDANPAGDNVTAYYVYWRIPPATTWLDTNRRSVVAVPLPTLDLATIGLAANSYEICVTAYRTGAESGPSNIVPFVYTVPGAPGGAKLQ